MSEDWIVVQYDQQGHFTDCYKLEGISVWTANDNNGITWNDADDKAYRVRWPYKLISVYNHKFDQTLCKDL